MIMGTFSKTLASLGGFVASEKAVINYLKHNSSALIFSASPTPASVASAIAALEILEAEPERVDKLIKNGNKMREGFRSMGFRVSEGRTPIIPVIIGDDMKTFQFWRKLFDEGIFVNAFVSPGVPPNMAAMAGGMGPNSLMPATVTGMPGGSKIVINTQPPLQEIWLAARAGGYHFKWDGAQWQDREGQEFCALLSRCASEQAGQALTFSA